MRKGLPKTERSNDIRILNDLLNAPVRDEGEYDSLVGLSSDEREAFEDMLEQIDSEDRFELSAKQRKWAKTRHAEMLLGDPSERNEAVPRGKEVQLPDVLKNLPKKPPSRKQSWSK